LNRVWPKPFGREFFGNAGSDGEKARVRIGKADSLKKLDGVEPRWIEVDDKKLWLDLRGQRLGLGEGFDRARAMARRELLQGGSNRGG
jgi:hypothetical protein